jgi:hypothetical protein
VRQIAKIKNEPPGSILAAFLYGDGHPKM